MNNNKNKQAEVSDFRKRVEEDKLIVVDCGQNSATFYDGKNPERNSLEITHEELLKLPLRPESKGYAMVGEDAHLGVARNEKSLSQPFNSIQLQSFYKACEENNIIFKTFPQKSTPRAAVYSDNEKSDATDPVSIYNMIKDFPKTSLRNPPTSFDVSDVRKEGYKHKEDLNKVLNFARRYDYTDVNAQWIKDNIKDIASGLSPVAQDAFKVSEEFAYKKGNKNKGIKAGDINLKKISMPQLYSIFSVLRGKANYNEETKKGSISDELNTRKSQDKLGIKKLPSWKFTKKHILCFSPHHQRGGVARSNLMYHGAKHYIVRKAKEEGFALKGKNRGSFNKKEDRAFVLHRGAYTQSVKEAFNLFKGML